MQKLCNLEDISWITRMNFKACVCHIELKYTVESSVLIKYYSVNDIIAPF